MNEGVKQGLGAAADAGARAFALRDAGDVIVPTRRRVRRHRAAVGATAGVAGVALVGAAAVGIDRWSTGIGPADGGHVTSNPTPSITAASTILSAPDYVAASKRQARSRIDVGAAQEGAICHTAPADDPRLPQGVYKSVGGTTLADCEPVWFPGTTLLSAVPGASVLTAESGTPDGTLTLTVHWAVVNSGTRSVVLDRNSAVVMVESRPNLTAGSIGAGSTFLTTTSVWEPDGMVLGVLSGYADPITLAPGETWEGDVTLTTVRGEQSPLNDILENGLTPKVTVSVRVHDAAPDGTSSVLVWVPQRDLGSVFTY